MRNELTEQFNEERRKIEDKLAVALRMEKEVAKEYDRLSAAAFKLASKNLDGEPTAKEQEAQRQSETAYRAVTGAWGEIASLRRELERLNDAELERQVQQLVETLSRVNGLRATKGATRMSTATRTRGTERVSNKVEVPAELRKRIAKLVKDGMGVSAVAALLNDEKVKRPASGKPDWYARAIYNIATKELGVDDLKSVRKSKPVASRAVKDNPPRKTTALPKKNGTAAKTGTAAKPLSKKSQASGTSRGGTGSRKSSPKTRAIAKRRASSKRK